MSGKTDSGLDVAYCSGWDNILGLREEWQALAARRGRGRPYAGAGYMLAALEAYHSGDDPALVVARGAGGALLGLMPLVRRSLNRFGLYVDERGFPFNPNVILNDPLIDAGAADAPEIARAMLSCAFEAGAETLILDHLSVETGQAGLMAGAGAAFRADPPREARALWFADLPGSYEDYMATRSRNHRWQVKKTWSKAEEAGALEVRRHSGAAQIRAALPEWFDIERRSWQASDPASAMGPADRAFHENLLDWLEPEEIGDLWIVALDGTPLAALRMLAGPATGGGNVSVHTLHFDMAARKLAPGLIAFDAMMQAACAEGLAEVDMHGTTDFFARWATVRRPHQSLRLYRPGVKGSLIRGGRQASLRLAELAARRGKAQEPQEAEEKAEAKTKAEAKAKAGPAKV